MSTLTITQPVVISPSCGCEESVFVPAPPGQQHVGIDACCNSCGHPVHLATDVEPHLDEGERVVWVNSKIHHNGNTYDGIVLAYFTESEED